MSEKELQTLQNIAASKLSAYIADHKIVTVGELTRKFPDYQRIILDVLDRLKIAGEAHWDEWKPMPTLIYSGSAPVTDRVYDWLARKSITA